MRRPGLILLAGTLAGTLVCGAATSQTSTVTNNQAQLGDILSDQTLNVVTVSGEIQATSTATGNVLATSTSGQDLVVTPDQALTGHVTALERLNVDADSGTLATVTSTADGNSVETSISGSTLLATITQAAGATQVSAQSHVEAPDAQAADADSLTQARGDAAAFSVAAGAATVAVTQTNAGTVKSDGGGVYGLVTGLANFQAVARGTDVQFTGTDGASSTLVSRQTNSGPLTQAAEFTAFGQAQAAQTRATAVGVNLDLLNEGAFLDADLEQSNSAYVRAQAETSAASFGALGADASAAGTYVMAGDVDGDLLLDSTQTNSLGGVVALAVVTGAGGYDAGAVASAAGNSATGYACAQCAGRISVASRQTNSADVAATATNTLSGSVRSASGVARATGNTATYYLSRPVGP